MKKKRILLPILIIVLLFAARSVLGGSGDTTASETVSDVIDIVSEISADTEDSADASAQAETEDASMPDESESTETESAEETVSGTEAAEEPSAEPETVEAENVIDEDGTYTSKDDVALYIHTYGHLPSNYVTKEEAEEAGWSGGSVEKYLPGKCIGGSYFGNYEGLLPDAPGRTWTECDIDTLGASTRGSKRIIFSNDGLIYYTGDHYETFELLYGNP